MSRKLTRLALQVAAGYAVIAGLWIVFSDRVLMRLTSDPVELETWSIVKGWFFVVVTAGLLYLILRRELRRADSEAQRRTDAEAALRESEARFRQVVETIDEVFWIADPERNEVLYVSPGFERIWGRHSNELYASPTIWQEAILPDDRVRVLAGDESRVPHGDREEEFRIKRPDGEVRWIHSKSFSVKSAGGQRNCTVGVAEDITARKRLEQQFLRAQRLESIGTLAGGVAHDLNNILAPILMVSSLLKESRSSPDDIKLIGMMETAAQRGAGIIRQLLTFSRGVEGQRSLVQVRHLIKETASIIRETFPRDITLETGAAADLWPVHTDPTLLHQIFMNLCVNARDAMPGGGQLSLKAENMRLSLDQARANPDARSGPYTVIIVSDTGEGIPTENLDRIFDPFFSTKAPGKGTGLGLSTVLGIVKSHNGFVTVSSELGKGTVIKVCLPAAPDAEVQTIVDNVDPAHLGHGEMILFVDDEADIRDATRHALEAVNYRVVTARDGEEAISLFLRHRDQLQLVVTDMLMPVMDGLALIRALRLLDARIAIVAASGLDHEDKVTELALLGVSTLLAKPYSVHALQDAVAEGLQRASSDPAPAGDWKA
ncbi:MAG TPA: ATP-binding protein [Opitutaceae bacterium]|nr:ATP-binding protein [Opitutaceae bacterium]